jgi:hypothetical protein
MDPNQLPCSHADAIKHLCHHTGLHLALSLRKNPVPVNLNPTTTVEM